MRKPFLVLAAIALFAASASAQTSTDIYRCRFLDVFNIEKGVPTRDSNSARLMALMNPTIIDTKSGIVRPGSAPDGGSPYTWRIEQQGGERNDFIASSGPSNRIHIRPWHDPVQILQIANNFLVATGICEPIR
jgi:hypothetical protein